MFIQYPTAVVTADKNDTTFLAKNQMVRFEIAPGKRDLECNASGGDKSKIDLDVEAGKVYFAKLTVSKGWSQTCEFKITAPEEAKPAAQKAEYKSLHFFK